VITTNRNPIHDFRPSTCINACSVSCRWHCAFTLALVAASDRARLAGPAGIAVAFGFPLAICYLFLYRPVRFGLGISALLIAAQFRASVHGQLLHAERSFFGIHRVTLDPTGGFIQLVHGSTVHGMQRCST
jgi:hypothetical protein